VWADQPGASQLLFDAECTDSPGGPTQKSPNPTVVDGVVIQLVGATPAGVSRRGWTGNRCAFEVRAADGSGSPVALGPDELPPFTTPSAVHRSGSAVFLSVSFNGYTAEFPKGGNRIIALDLCQGRVVWKSKDSMSNGGLLLLDDYLVSPYGFTSERRYVYVLDAHSGVVVQKLPVIENVCPSKGWAPHYHPGERCDAPGQAVGAATDPRIDGGLFFVDTNTGSSAFELASHGAGSPGFSGRQAPARASP
jgi:outer membrane protein assembly factor BamB